MPVVASQMARAGACKAGVVRLAQFSSGAHAELYAALKREQKRGAKAFVLDLRGNGGGLVSEAQLVASAFLRSGKIVTTKGRVRARAHAAARPATRSSRRSRSSCSSTRAPRRRRRSSPARCRTATARRSSATQTFGKGVFQEVIELSNGGALDITAGQYFTPNGRNLGGRGVATGSGIQPDVKATDDPKTTKRDEAQDRALAVLARSCRG